MRTALKRRPPAPFGRCPPCAVEESMGTAGRYRCGPPVRQGSLAMLLRRRIMRRPNSKSCSTRVSVRPAPSENPDSMTVHTPDAPENEEWDVVVVGTGMGGSTIGYALARRGLRVLFLEKGRFLQGARVGGDGRLGMDDDQSPEGLLDRGLWPHPIRGDTSSGTREFAAAVGCGSGGTPNVYAGGLERLGPWHFAPRQRFPAVEISTL